MKWLGPVDLALQQAAWWSAVLLAAAGRPLAGAAAALAPVAVHVLLRPAERARLGRAAGAGALLAIALQWAIGLPLLSRVSRVVRASRGRAPAAAGAGPAAAEAAP